MKGRIVFAESESRGIGQDDITSSLAVESFAGMPCEMLRALPLSVTHEEIRQTVPAVAGLLLLVAGRHRPEKVEDIPASEVKEFVWVEDLRAAALEAWEKIHLLEHRFNDDDALSICFVIGDGIDAATAIVRGLSIEAGWLPPDYVPDATAEQAEVEAFTLAALAAQVHALGIKSGRARRST